jgi:hypothetical protein
MKEPRQGRNRPLSSLGFVSPFQGSLVSSSQPRAYARGYSLSALRASKQKLCGIRRLARKSIATTTKMILGRCVRPGRPRFQGVWMRPLESHPHMNSVFLSKAGNDLLVWMSAENIPIAIRPDVGLHSGSRKAGAAANRYAATLMLPFSNIAVCGIQQSNFAVATSAPQAAQSILGPS